MKVYDIVHGFNEIETYRIRQHELRRVVDTFVVVEGLFTFTGKKRTPRFNGFPDIIHITLSVQHSNAWEAERIHRDSIPLIDLNIQDNDIIIYSDLDEIPKAIAVEEAINILQTKNYATVKIELLTYYLFYNTRMPDEIVTVAVTTGKHIKQCKPFTVRKSIPDYTIAGFNGWHFTSCGGIDIVKEKLVAWSHTEYAHLAECIEQFYDPPRRPFCNTHLTTDPINTMPEYIQVNEKYYRERKMVK